MKYLKSLNKEKGVAGIEILIEIVIGLFILGVLVFCITLMGAEISDNDSFYDTVSATLTNDTTNAFVSANSSTHPNGLSVYPTSVSPENRNCALTVTWTHLQGSDGGLNDTIASGNYTTSGCYIYFSTTGTEDAENYNNTDEWNVTGSWSYQEGQDSVGIMNETYQTIGDVVEWFPIIIIFGAIVVLILLTVLIIRTVKTSGYGGGLGSGGRETA